MIGIDVVSFCYHHGRSRWWSLFFAHVAECLYTIGLTAGNLTDLWEDSINRGGREAMAKGTNDYIRISFRVDWRRQDKCRKIVMTDGRTTEVNSVILQSRTAGASITSTSTRMSKSLEWGVRGVTKDHQGSPIAGKGNGNAKASRCPAKVPAAGSNDFISPSFTTCLNAARLRDCRSPDLVLFSLPYNVPLPSSQMISGSLLLH